MNMSAIRCSASEHLLSSQDVDFTEPASECGSRHNTSTKTVISELGTTSSFAKLKYGENIFGVHHGGTTKRMTDLADLSIPLTNSNWPPRVRIISLSAGLNKVGSTAI